MHAKNNGSNEESVNVARSRRKGKSAPFVPVLPSSQSSEVQVIEQVELDLEVDTQVDLPQTGHFGEDFALPPDEDESVAADDDEETDIEGERSVNLLDEEEDS